NTSIQDLIRNENLNRKFPTLPFIPTTTNNKPLKFMPPKDPLSEWPTSDADRQTLEENLLALLSSSSSPQSDYQQMSDYLVGDEDYQPVDDGYFYAVDGQNAWFDGPILPKVNPISGDDQDQKVNNMLVNYLLSQYYGKGASDVDDEEMTDDELSRW